MKIETHLFDTHPSHEGFLMKLSICLAALFALTSLPMTQAVEKSLQMIEIESSLDGEMQMAMIYVPENAADKAIPLLVVLHSWSNGYDQKAVLEPCHQECEERGWAIIHPDFRGPNVRPEACASKLAKQDIMDAVDEMKSRAKVDESRIYLVGSSGGGHMSLVMAAHTPETWAGVSAWVPISDLKAWHEQTTRKKLKYARDIEKCCGGKPGDSAKIDQQYYDRSPIHFLAKAKGLPIDINTGIHDGHTGSVPVSQSLHAFNVLAKANGEPDQMIADADIESITETQQIPAALADQTADDSLRQHEVLFRRSASSAQVTIFKGGHESDMPCAVRWLANQQRTE